jgi:hypothetical protein
MRNVFTAGFAFFLFCGVGGAVELNSIGAGEVLDSQIEPVKPSSPASVSGVAVKGGSSKSASEDPDKRYSTSCRMDDYYAYAIVINHSRKLDLTIDGDVKFVFYAADGDEEGNTEERAHETISRGDSEEVAKHYYPNGTKTCVVEVFSAVSWEGEEDNDSTGLSSNCELSGGKGYGYIHNGGRKSVRVSGRATWYFYDDDGDELDNDDDRVTETIGGGDTVMVGAVSAPSRAVSCSLDISGLSD